MKNDFCNQKKLCFDTWTKCLNLENNMQSKVNQAQITNTELSDLMKYIEKGKFIEIDSREEGIRV